MRKFQTLLFLCIVFSATALAHRNPILCFDMRYTLRANYSDSLSLLSLWDDLHTISTLQGIVNRRKPQLYIEYVENGGRNIDAYWWSLYRRPGEWLHGADTVQAKSVEEVVKCFASSIRGAVVYDSRVASTSNVASAIAGIEDLIAVRYDERPGSLYSRLVKGGLGIPVKVWLLHQDGTPMFTGSGMIPGAHRVSSGSLKCDPYLWFIEHYMKTNKVNGEYAGYYLDQYWRKMANRGPRNHHTLTNHDFFVSRKGFFFDLSPWEDEPATDDSTQSLGTDRRTLLEMLTEAYRINKGKVPCHVGGFPAWAYKYTDAVGGKHGGVETEWHFAELISTRLTFKDADAIGYGAMANASFWQHFPLRGKYRQKWTTRKALQSKGLLTKEGKVDTTKKYVVIYVGDYDASSWITQEMPILWDTPHRGKTPMMWSVSPVLSRRAPMVMHHLRATATPNDYFAAADNGAGYLMPGVLEWEDKQHPERPSMLKAWQRHCKKQYEKWGLTITGFIIDGNGPGMDRKGMEAYSSFSKNGIVPQKCPLIGIHKNMPVLRSDYDLVDGDPKLVAQVMLQRMSLRKGVPFIWFRTILKSPEWHTRVIEEVQKLDADVVLLDAPSFFELYRCWLKENGK